MSTLPSETDARNVSPEQSPVLEIRVKNHPGVMSHICGLFARRAFNVEKILCLPLGKGEHSRIWLTVNDGHRLDQVIKQAMKLEDVLHVRIAGVDEEIFGPVTALLQEEEARNDETPCIHGEKTPL